MLVEHVNACSLMPNKVHPAHSYASLALCIVDSVYSIGVRYTGVVNTVARFAKSYGWNVTGRDRYSKNRGQFDLEAFVSIFNGFSSEQAADGIFGNRQRTSTKNGILKAEACNRFAQAMLDVGIKDFPILGHPALLQAEANVLCIEGQRSGISWDYFRLLAGDDDLIKPDRRVIEFVAKSQGKDISEISPRLAAVLVKSAARVLKVSNHEWTASRLDFAVWSHVSKYDPKDKAP